MICESLLYLAIGLLSYGIGNFVGYFILLYLENKKEKDGIKRRI